MKIKIALIMRAAADLARFGWPQSDIDDLFFGKDFEPKNQSLSVAVKQISSKLKTDKADAAKTRDADLVARYSAGETLEEIGFVWRITRERVRQLLKRYGITGVNGGGAIRGAETKKLREMEKNDRVDSKRMRSFGCSAEEFLEWNGGLKTIGNGIRSLHYQRQRNSALQRGIEWAITFPEWCKAWEDSGHEHERGRGKYKYVMSRIGDAGPYSAGNIKIITLSQNSAESYIHKPSSKRYRREDKPHRIDQVVALVRAGVDTPKEIAATLSVKTQTASQYLLQARQIVAAESQPGAVA